MDGTRTLPALRSPVWASQSRELFQAGRVSGFLQRDLSEQALKQPVEPMFSRADLAAARRDGVELGRAAGLAEAAASRAATEVEALALIAAALADGRTEAVRVADQAAGALARALVAAMDAVMPDLVRRSALDEAGAMLAHVLPGLSREPHVRVEVPREVADGVEAALAKLTPEHRGRICVTGLERAGAGSLEAGEVQVRWSSGHAQRRPEQVWRTVMDALGGALGGSGSEDDDNGG